MIFTLSNGTRIELPTRSAFEALQRLCNETNTNLAALQGLVSALQNNDSITSVDPLTENGKVVGYTIKFAKSNPIVIYNGKDGANGTNGVDGTTPVIGVKQDVDGIYYWTSNGAFILVDGQKIRAQGTNGADGADGITPELKIESGYWYISYDNGATWTQLGKATGENGQDADGIKITQDENNVYFELADGTVITIAKSDPTEEDAGDSRIIQFKDMNVKAICVQNWDTNNDGELSYGEAAKVTSIKKIFRGTTIQSFDELQYFTGIDEIGVEAFRYCKDLTSITIPETVVGVEDFAFRECYSLINITIPENVTWIGESAFNRCSSLINATIGNKVTSIGNDAFLYCANLKSITIPDSVTFLGSGAFQGCSSLATATISNNITTIKNSTFFACALISIIIPNCVTSIGSTAFMDCNHLKSIVIPINVTSIGSSAFAWCDNLKEIYCTPTTPPLLEENTIFSDIASDAVFYIPMESVNSVFDEPTIGLQLYFTSRWNL